MPEAELERRGAPAMGAVEIHRGRGGAWDRRLVEASGHDIEMKPYHESTYRRRKRVRAIYNLLKNRVTGPAGLIGTMAQVYSWTTAWSYALTMQAEFPQLAKDRGWKDALLWLEKQKAKRRLETHQAEPATPIQVQTLLKGPGTLQQKTALAVMWNSLSRYGDIQHMVTSRIWNHLGRDVLVKVNLEVWKSDPHGRRHASKTFILPGAMVPILMKGGIPSYNQMLSWIKSSYPTLSCHSFRRGGVSFAAGFHTGEEIVALTMHTMPGEPVAIRLYTDPRARSKETETQMRVSEISSNNCHNPPIKQSNFVIFSLLTTRTTKTSHHRSTS